MGLAACANPRPSPAPVPVAARPGAPSGVPTVAAGPPADQAYLRARGLMVPVLGVYPDRVPDTFNARRSGDRVHRATDIMAPRGTPVLSADDGRVLRLDHNTLGGNTIFAVDPAGRLVYYYAHLDRYEGSIRAGTLLRKGEVIGYVGSTGDAAAGAPHLHFQVMRFDEPRRWWAGTPLDAYHAFAIAGEDR